MLPDRRYLLALVPLKKIDAHTFMSLAIGRQKLQQES